jgi:hypothetical protein
MDNLPNNKGRSASRRLIIALVSCAFGATLILLVSQMGSKSTDQSSTAKENSPVTAQQKKTQRAWNIALGNVVVVVPDLGLNAKTIKGGDVDEAKIATRLESQLQGLRDFYRQESEREATLMGGMVLQLTVSPSGEVTHVKELVSRITDGEFKKAVLEEASKWTFPEIITDSATINCPILFVREGMDITTIVQWEKTLGQFSAIAKPSPQLTQRSQAQEAAKRNEPVARNAAVSNKAKAEPNLEAKSQNRIYQVKFPTTIRQEPNFGSQSIGKFSAGTRITIIALRGDWAEVREDNSSLSGFIRREFLAPVELTQKK